MDEKLTGRPTWQQAANVSWPIGYYGRPINKMWLFDAKLGTLTIIKLCMDSINSMIYVVGCKPGHMLQSLNMVHFYFTVTTTSQMETEVDVSIAF